MRVIVVGGTGLIGSAVVEALEEMHDVVPVGHSSGEHRVDLASRESIREMYDAVGAFDALVSAAGVARFGALEELSDDDFDTSLHNKMRGQIDLVRYGLGTARDGASFTLTTGVLATIPIEGSAAITPVNAGVEGFVKAAALEMPREMRINAVSPPWVAETLEMLDRDPSAGMPAAEVARAYVAAVEGGMSGRVLSARDYAV